MRLPFLPASVAIRAGGNEVFQGYRLRHLPATGHKSTVAVNRVSCFSHFRHLYPSRSNTCIRFLCCPVVRNREEHRLLGHAFRSEFAAGLNLIRNEHAIESALPVWFAELLDRADVFERT